MSTPAAVLRTASYHGDLVLVKNLLLEGVDPNVADEYHRTALSHAAGRGHMAVVDELLTGGAWAEPHEDYDVYNTPLMEAVIHGHLEIVKKLVEAGANPSFHVGVSQRTAASYAEAYGHRAIVEYLAGLPRL